MSKTHNLLASIHAYRDVHKGALPEGMYISALQAGRDPFSADKKSGAVLGESELCRVVANSNSKDRAVRNAVADFGYNIDITTLTQVRQEVVEQTFYEEAPADFFDVSVGEGAWMQELVTYLSFATGDGFESGIINDGQGALKKTDTAIAPLKTPIKNWAKELEYNVFELNQAMKAANWSLISAKEEARKKNWDLGIQKISFLGLDTDTNVKGLLNNTNVNSNTSLITKFISSMDANEFQAFVAGFISAFLSNANQTATPDHFIMPLADFAGCVAATSDQFPIIDKISYMEKAFSRAIGGKPFTIKGLAYCDQNYNNLGLNRYVAYKRRKQTLLSFIPVDYTSVIAGSINQFQFQSVAYGQFTGVQINKPLEVLYFDFAN
jgi:hypothetical protein